MFAETSIDWNPLISAASLLLIAIVGIVNQIKIGKVQNIAEDAKIIGEQNKTSVKGLRLFSMPATSFQFGLKNTTTAETFENKTLSVRGVYVNDNLGQDLRELSQRISQYKPWFLKHYFLEAIAILFMVLSVGLIVILIAL